MKLCDNTALSLKITAEIYSPLFALLWLDWTVPLYLQLFQLWKLLSIELRRKTRSWICRYANEPSYELLYHNLTYVPMQWAAVITHRSATKVPPQNPPSTGPF